MAGWSFTPPKTLGDVPQASYGDHPAVIVPETSGGAPAYTVTYAAFAKEVESMARRLRSLLAAVETPSSKTKAEKVVALAMVNNLEFAIGFLGTAWAGAATAPLNPSYKVDEFAFYLEDNGVDILLLSPEGNANASQAAVGLQVPVYEVRYDPASQTTHLIKLSGPGPETVGSQGGSLPTLDPESSVMYMHTSGTTSRPKRVQLLHRNLVSTLRNIQATYELSPADRTLLVMPLFHVHGLIAGLLSTFASGGTVILPPRFMASGFWSQIVTHAATWYTAVPTMHQILLMRADTDYPKDNPPKLRFIRSCSASLAASVLERLETTFHAPVLEAYAMTENAHQMASNPLPKYGPRKPGSVGKATGIELAILDDECRVQPPGVGGEVCIKGASVTPGYVNNPSANEDGFKGGWFHTGDQGVLDEEGYLTLTGRIKELINRGGEKISPLEIDAVLLSHPLVAEAVSFAAPDPKYGEEVNAVVTVKPGHTLTEADVLAHARKQLADFKIPRKLYIATDVPRTATGKIQRRIVAEYFLKGGDAAAPAAKDPAGEVDGYLMVAKALYAAGVRYMFGVVGIPVTRLAPCAQEVGIRFISFRNEQAASYAASAAGYITGFPAALLTVSGPGVVHGLAGLANAQINGWPVIMISGSTPAVNVGRGGFQELDQIAATTQYAKLTCKVTKIDDIAGAVAKAVAASLEGRPGGVYIDVPGNVLHEKLGGAAVEAALGSIPSQVKALLPQTPANGSVSAALQSALTLLRSAKRPLLVLGKGAAFSRAEGAIRELVDRTGIPFLATPMGKGVVPDDHPLNAAAARSLVLKQADVVVVVGARLNWILHFGEPPRWSPEVKFIVIDVAKEAAGTGPNRLVIEGPAQAVVPLINKDLSAKPWKIEASGEWVTSIKAKVDKNSASLAARLTKMASPMDYHTVYNILLRHLSAQSPQPVVVSEGANTMDIGRSLIPISEPRTRLDAGTWGTMGVGLGYAIAAATVDPSRLVVAIEGDSAFGFSGMEVETMCRYKLRVVVIIFNNNGIYGGHLESDPACAFPKDPNPTAFVPDARYEKLAEAFGGLAFFVQNPSELDAAVTQAFASNGPAVINVDIDPLCGVESGSLTDHN